VEPQNFLRPLDVRLLQYRNRQALKKRRKPRADRRPTDLGLPDPMLGTLDPRNPGVQKCLKLTGVQMATDPFRRMVINRKLRPALRARPEHALLMGRPAIHLRASNVQLNLLHSPMVLKIQSMPIKHCGIFHDSDHLGTILSQLVTH